MTLRAGFFFFPKGANLQLRFLLVFVSLLYACVSATTRRVYINTSSSVNLWGARLHFENIHIIQNSIELFGQNILNGVEKWQA